MDGCGLLLPVRNVKSLQVEWHQAEPARVLAALHDPIYAGAYVYGRSEERMGLVDGQRGSIVRARLYRRDGRQRRRAGRSQRSGKTLELDITLQALPE